MDGPYRDIIVSPSALDRATGQLDQINRARAANGQPPLTVEVTRQTRPDTSDPIMVWERVNVRVSGATQEDLDTLHLANINDDPERRVKTEAVLAAACSITRIESSYRYVSRQEGGENSTPALVLQYVNDAPDGPLRRRYQPTAVDESNTLGVRAWARQTQPTNHYVKAMRHALAEDQLGLRDVGNAASALAGYYRAITEMGARDEQLKAHLTAQLTGEPAPPAPTDQGDGGGQGSGGPDPGISRWLSWPGEKIMVTGRVESIYERVLRPNWPHWMFIIRTPDGNAVRGKTTRPDGMTEGDEVTLHAYVKAHIVERGEKQTEMLHCYPEVHPRPQQT